MRRCHFVSDRHSGCLLFFIAGNAIYSYFPSASERQPRKHTFDVPHCSRVQSCGASLRGNFYASQRRWQQPCYWKTGRSRGQLPRGGQRQPGWNRHHFYPTIRQPDNLVHVKKTDAKDLNCHDAELQARAVEQPKGTTWDASTADPTSIKMPLDVHALDSSGAGIARAGLWQRHSFRARRYPASRQPVTGSQWRNILTSSWP